MAASRDQQDSTATAPDDTENPMENEDFIEKTSYSPISPTHDPNIDFTNRWENTDASADTINEQSVQANPSREATSSKQAAPTANKGMSLRVSNLHPRVSYEDIRELFSEFGAITKCKMDYDAMGHPECARVAYKKTTDALKALRTYNGVPLDGRALRIEVVTTSKRSLEKKACITTQKENLKADVENNFLQEPHQSVSSNSRYKPQEAECNTSGQETRNLEDDIAVIIKLLKYAPLSRNQTLKNKLARHLCWTATKLLSHDEQYHQIEPPIVANTYPIEQRQHQQTEGLSRKKPKRKDICWGCREKGHWKVSCKSHQEKVPPDI